MTTKILVADDSKTIQKVIRIALSRFATTIETAGSYSDVVAHMAKNAPALIIADCMLSGTNSPADFQKIALEGGKIPVILLVGSYEEFNEQAFKQVGLAIFVRKPFEAQDIVKAVNSVLSQPLELKKHPTQAKSPVEESAPIVADAKSVPPPPPPPGFSRKIPDVTVPPPPVRESSAPAVTTVSDVSNKGKQAPIVDPSFVGYDDQPSEDDINYPYDEDPSGYFGMDDEDTLKKKLPEGEDVARVVRVSEDHAHRRQAESSAPKVLPPQAAAPSSELLEEIRSMVPQMVRDEVERVVAEEVEVTVRKFLEAYCDKNVKSLVKEIVTSEIRRLTDEKARHLIDGKP